MSIHPDDLTTSLFEALCRGASETARAQFAQIRELIDDRSNVVLDCSAMGGSWLGSN